MSNEATKRLTAFGEQGLEDLKHFSECLVKCLPDSKSFSNYLESQLKTLNDEIASDKTLKETTQFL